MKVKGCEYIRNTYNVPACIGRQIEYNGRHGILSADRGNYIGVTFDDEPATTISNFHPLEKGLVYGGIGNVRKMTRSQISSQIKGGREKWKITLYKAPNTNKNQSLKSIAWQQTAKAIRDVK